MGVCENYHKLLGGELLVYPYGIFTMIHEYEHPVSGKRVFMVGMNHFGDECYYRRALSVLENCDLVLYEKLSPELPEEMESELKKIILNGETDDAFLPSFWYLFSRARRVLNLSSESEFFDYNHTGWFPADNDLVKDINIGEIPYERRREIVLYVREKIKRMDEGTFTKKEIGEAFVFLYSDPVLVKCFEENLSIPRDRFAFNVFDRLVEEKDPAVIGIKYGAAHIKNQRALLEERGYVLRSSEKICNIGY